MQIKLSHVLKQLFAKNIFIEQKKVMSNNVNNNLY